MPRTTSGTRSTVRGRRRSARSGSDTRLIVDQIANLVTANEGLQRENRELIEENRRLKGELLEIGSALGRLTGPQTGRRNRRGAVEIPGVPEAKPKRQRKPITDPVVLEKRKQALAKARAARAERLAAARASAAEAAGAAQ